MPLKRHITDPTDAWGEGMDGEVWELLQSRLSAGCVFSIVLFVQNIINGTIIMSLPALIFSDALS